MNKFKKYYPELIFGMGFFTYLVFFYPGFMTNDSANQILQARSGEFGNWHPPLMAYIWSILDRIYPGPFGMLLLQTLLVWVGGYLTFKGYLINKRSNINATIIVAVMFLPQIFGIAGVIWKDNFMWGALFVAIGISGKIENLEKKNAIKQMLLFLAILFFLFIATAIRINGIFAVFGIVLLVFYRSISERFKYRKLSIISSGIVVALCLLALSIVVNKMIAEKEKNPLVPIAIFDIVGVIKNTNDDTFNNELYNKIPIAIRNEASIDSLINSYTPEYWQKLFDTHKGPLKNENGGTFSEINRDEMTAIKGAWIYSILHKPKAWLTHRLNVYSHVLGIVKGPLWGFAVMEANAFNDDYKKAYGENKPTTWIQHGIGWRIQKLSKLWIFKPWFYLIIIVIILIFQIGSKRNDGPTVFISLGGIMHEGMLFFIAPSPDYRYSHYMVFSCILAIIFCLRRDKSIIET